MITATGTAGNISFDNGASSFREGLSLYALDGIVMNQDVTTNVASSGTVYFDADTDNTGAGNFEIASTKTLDTNDNALSITAANMLLNGTIDATSKAITLLPSTNSTVFLGTNAGDFSLDNDELGRIVTTGQLTIGNNLVTSMTINGWTAAVGLTGLILLVATGTSGSISFTTVASSFNGALTLHALSGVSLTVGVTTSGVTTVDADFDDASGGAFSVTDFLTTFDTGGNALNITASDITLTDLLNAGAVTLTVSDGGTIAFGTTGQSYNLESLELDNITSTSLTLQGSTTSITVGSISSSQSATAGNITLDATSTNAFIVFTANAAFVALDANADDYIQINSGLTLTTTGHMDFLATGGIQAQGSVNLTAGGTLTLRNTLTAAGAVTFTANDIDLQQTLDAGINNVNIFTNTENEIYLGTANAAGLSLDDTELDRVTTSGTLTIGNATSDTITINNWSVDGDITGAVMLKATANGGQIIFTSNSSSLPANVTLHATDGVQINISLTAAGNLTIDADNTDAGDDNGTFSTTASIVINNNGNFSLTADDVAIGGSISNGTGLMTFNVSDNGTIELSTTPASNFSLSIVEFDFLSTASLTINSSGSMTIGAVDVNGSEGDQIDTLVLTVGDLSINGIASFNALTVTATGITLGATISTISSGALSLDAGAGTIQINSGANLTAAGLLSLSADTGVTAAQALTLTGAGVTLNNDVSTSSGALTVDASTGTLTLNAGADLTAAGALSLSPASAISVASGEDLTLTGVNVTLSDSIATTAGGNLVIDAGTGSVTINAGANLTADGSLTLSGDGGISAGQDLTLTGTGISINDSVTTTGSANLTLEAGTGALSINSGANLTAAGLLSLSADIGVTAAQALTLTGVGVTLNNDVSTSSGALTVDASTGALSINSGANLTAAGLLSLSADTGVTAAQALTLTGVGVTLNNDVSTSSGGLTVDASTGTLTLNAGADLTAAGALSLSPASAISVASGEDLTLTGVNVTLSDSIATTAGGNLVIDAGTGSVTINAGANLTADGSLTLSGDGGISAAQDLTLTGTGISINDSVTTTGSANLTLEAGTGALSINSGANLTAAGLLSLSADTGVTAAQALTLTGVGVSLNNDVSTSSGALTVDASTGTLTLNAGADLTAAGALSLSPANAISVASGEDLTLTGVNVTLSDSIATTAGGNLIIDAGTGSVTINAGANLTADGGLTLSGDGGISAAQDLTLTGTGVTINDSVTTTGSASLTVDAGVAGTLTINDGASLTAAGALTISPAGTVTVESGEDLTLTGVNVTLSDSIATTAGGNLVIDAGTGSVTINAGANLTADGSLTLSGAASHGKGEALTASSPR